MTTTNNVKAENLETLLQQANETLAINLANELETGKAKTFTTANFWKLEKAQRGSAAYRRTFN